MARVADIKNDDAKQGWFAYEYERPSVTVDIVCIYSPAFETNNDEVLLIKRGGNPYKGHMALPGGFMEMNETCKEAAVRELEEEVGLKVTDLINCGVNDDVFRDTRSRVISISYIAYFSQRPVVTAGDDAAEAKWVSMDEAKKLVLAFDHNQILKNAIEVWKRAR
jgi:8-oxo-dGTP diphosphatase